MKAVETACLLCDTRLVLVWLEKTLLSAHPFQCQPQLRGQAHQEVGGTPPLELLNSSQHAEDRVGPGLLAESVTHSLIGYSRILDVSSGQVWALK